MIKRATIWILAGRLGLAWAWVAASWAGEVSDYTAQVKPIFSEHCYRCHGASQQKAQLRVDTASFIRAGGESGAAVQVRDAKGSLLVRLLRGEHPTLSAMPYKKPPLSEDQIRAIERWIDAGAEGPANEEPEKKIHWAFLPPERPPLPPNSDPGGENPIDLLVRAQLANRNLRSSAEAPRTTLLRRLSLDLTGLPPGPEELEAFLRDTGPDAYHHAVDRLLGSPRYGERWARWWLDAARYGDSNGYSIDAPRPIWKYRDWVVAALNADAPFDQFALEQLAGDLLPGASIAQKVATGFNRNTQINQEGGIDPEQFHAETIVDRVNTFGTVFLGLTIACAQCHDHKFDPVTRREYYQLYAFFNNTVPDGHGQGQPGGLLEIPGEFEASERLEKEMAEASADLDRLLNTRGNEAIEWEKQLTGEQRAALAPEIRDSAGTPWSQRTIGQKRALFAAFKPDEPEFKARHEKLAKLERREPKPVTTLVLRELDQPRDTHVFIQGDFTRLGEKVSPGVPAILHPLPAAGSPLNRLDLARWLIRPENPLLARVIVNRVWQQYFGRGLVETENDFGTQGSLPSHPELLDWLAREWIEPSAVPGRPWSLKRLHRLIVTSATYRQSSFARPDLMAADPANRFLARQSRLRLDAEMVRDVSLAASGLLFSALGGPPVFPPQPDGVMSLGQVNREWQASAGPSRYRRALYTHLWRATPHPALAVFDAPDGFSSCTRRLRSNTPLQALTLLNDRQFFEFAQALAARLERAPAADDAARIEYAFKLCVGRQPAPAEMETVRRLIDPSAGHKWLAVARVLLNLDETITRE